MSYVKKYNPGQIRMDLPTANYIYELPLLSFGDIRGGMNLSLMFHYGMKDKLEQLGLAATWNLIDGYKLNVQKQLRFKDACIYYLEENGNVTSITTTKAQYTFDDDSKRILRPLNSEYVVENPDGSSEHYNPDGKIMAVCDKYNNAVLSYGYDSDGKLISLTYRGEKTISFSYSGAYLNKIQSSFCSDEITLQMQGTNMYILDMAGVSHSIVLGDNMAFAAKAYTTDEDGNVAYAERVCAAWDGDKTITLTSEIENNVVDSVAYTYPAWVGASYAGATSVLRKQVEVTDRYGVTTRTQYNGRKAMYAYEITGTDVEFGEDGKPVVPIQILNGAEQNADVKVVGSYGDCDGIALNQLISTSGDSLQEWVHLSLNSLGTVQGYYVTGWARTLDETCLTDHKLNIFYGSSSLGLLPLNLCSADHWSFFVFAISWAGREMHISPDNDAMTELKDVRIFYRKDNTIRGSDEEHFIVSEDVLISHVVGESDIPLSSAEFYCNDEIVTDTVTFSDLLKYKINQRKNINTGEFYVNDVKNLIRITGTGACVAVDGEQRALSEFYLARKTYTASGCVVTRIRDDDASSFLVYETLDADGNILSAQVLDEYLDVVSATADGITTTYVRDQGLVTSETVRENTNNTLLYTRTTAYGEDDSGKPTITATDEFGGSTVYTLDPVWGVVKSVKFPDDSQIVDAYDDDGCTRFARVFPASTPRTNVFTYSNGNLSKLSTNDLYYNFTYANGKLTGISKNGTTIEQHVYTDADPDTNTEAKIESYYPTSASPLRSTKATYDKYGRLTAIDGAVTNVYDNCPTFDSTTGALNVTCSNGGAQLAMTTDAVLGETARFRYYDNGMLMEKAVTDKTDFSDKVSQETFEYDALKRLTKDTCTYDSANSKKITSTIGYVKAEDDLSADNRVAQYTYAIDGSGTAATTNVYDNFKRMTTKTHTVGGKQFSKRYYYENTRVDYTYSTAGGYTYYEQDACGRLVSVTAYGKTTNYHYDLLGQLRREDNQALDKTILYSYNVDGNLDGLRTYDYTTDSAPDTMLATTSLSYSGDKLTGFGDETISYNAIGCPTSYDGKTATWSKGRLTKLSKGSISTTMQNYTYTYNGLGQRVARNYTFLRPLSDDQAVVQDELIKAERAYDYDHAGRLISETVSRTYRDKTVDTETIVFLYDESGIIGMEYTLNGSKNTYYFHRNLLGDVLGIYDTSGTLVAKYLYDAWGNCTISGETTNYAVANANPIRYRGYYYDDDTGLYYCNARYYSPKWHRFISPDDTSYLNPETVNGLNQYCYCGNDPVNTLISQQKCADTVVCCTTKWGNSYSSNLPKAKNSMHWEGQWFDTGWPGLFVFSTGKAALIDWGLSIYKGSLFFDEAENHSLYIALVNASTFVGFNVEKDKYGIFADANVLSAGYDGRYIDAGISFVGVGFVFGFENKKFRFKIDPPGFFGFEIAIDFGQILKDLFGWEW